MTYTLTQEHPELNRLPTVRTSVEAMAVVAAKSAEAASGAGAGEANSTSRAH